MNNHITERLVAGCRITVTILGMVIITGCMGPNRERFCESKKKILMKKEIRDYLSSWIKKNVINAPDLEATYYRHGGPGTYKATKKVDFNWKLLELSEPGEIDLFGENLDNIEIVYFGEGFRQGILVSLRDDKKFPSNRFNKNRICYQFEGFAVFYNQD